MIFFTTTSVFALFSAYTRRVLINYHLTLVAEEVEERRFFVAGALSLAFQPPRFTHERRVDARDRSKSSSEREYDISDRRVPGKL